MVRLTYTKYKEYGGQADEEFFNKTILEAEAFLSARTMGKVDKELSPELSIQVHKAIVIYIDSSFATFNDYAQSIERGGVKSESVLSHSITYESFSISDYYRVSKLEARKDCLRVLLPTGLLNTSVPYTYV